MIAKLSGTLAALTDEVAYVAVGPIELEVLVPHVARQHLQNQIGQPVTLWTTVFLEGNALHGRLSPRLVGFVSQADRDFFLILCDVEKMGVRKALKALAAPASAIAQAIGRHDVGWLSDLPGIGTAMARKLIGALEKKIGRFLPAVEAPAERQAATDGMVQDAYQGLLTLGHTPAEARRLIERALGSGKSFASAEELIVEACRSGL
ncbi:MAG: Holliday junction DNA helicase RuvA [Gemmataceae bacterium]